MAWWFRQCLGPGQEQGAQAGTHGAMSERKEPLCYGGDSGRSLAQAPREVRASATLQILKASLDTVLSSCSAEQGLG